MACTDTTELCYPNAESCWSMVEIRNETFPPQYWHMKWSLEASTIKDAITWRLGSALIAQELVGQYRSLPLPDNHWEAEATRLFETSLARIQFDAFRIASGEDRNLPGFVENTPDEARGRLCGHYKFNTADHSNINLAAFLGLLLAAIAIGILSIEARRASRLFCCFPWCRKWAEEPADPVWEPLIANVLLKWLIIVLIVPFWLLFLGLSWIYRKVAASQSAT